MAEGSRELIEMGRVAGLYGVRGWVKVWSYTQPRENLLAYPEWILRRGEQEWTVSVEARVHGRGLVARLGDIEDRDAAAAWVGADILVPRAALPPLAPGEYYWSDLIGLEVVTLTGTPLGEVADLLETGANDVLVVRGDRERLVPYVKDTVVHEVDLAARRIRVDWDPDF
ncbi:ribosome maturation factor RimM [Ectothiorhodospiraceae bacterium 2226]|nr:ribosome maturation factor RimM [Ectothiorhodospiraceae bacterium 2226]